ncbi:hypothetical protein Q7P37_006664 [Cladosporium fusiforme]
MSGTSAISTGLATSTPTNACTSLYNPPNQDAVCAMPYSDDYFNYMSSCCGDAQIVSYDDDCGIYCVALDQTISDLIDCLMDKGAEKSPQDVFCSGNTTESKTEDGDVPETAGVSVVATGSSGGKDGDGDKGGSGSGSGNGDATGTSSSDDASETGSGAAGGDVRSSISSTAMLAGSVMLLCFAIGVL